MCLFNEAELNCVNTKIRSIPECRQLEIGISTNRYLPAIGTAGFERVAVSGYKRLPWPPPSTMQITFEVISLGVLYFDTGQYIVWQKCSMKNRVPSSFYAIAA